MIADASISSRDRPDPAKSEAQSPIPPVLHDSVRLTPEGFRIELGGDRVIPLLDTKGPILTFNPGWMPGVVLTVFHPLLLLQLNNADQSAYWVFDGSGRFLMNDVADLDVALRERVRVHMALALRWLEQDRLSTLRCEVPSILFALLACAPSVRVSLSRIKTEDESAADGIAPETIAILAGDYSDRLGSRAPVPPDQLSQAMPALQPGWHIEEVVSRTAPALILLLRHESGGGALWYSDSTRPFHSNTPLDLSGPAFLQFRDWCRLWFTGLRERLIDRVAVAPDEELDWFIACDDVVRGGMQYFHGAVDPWMMSEPSASWVLGNPPPAGMAYVVASEVTGRLQLLAPDTMRAACNHPLRDALMQMAMRGSLSWPSPVSGELFEAAPHSIYFDSSTFLYKMYDATHGITFYLLCMNDFFRVLAVYFPGADLVVYPNASDRDQAVYYTASIHRRIVGHVCDHAQDLVPALLVPPREAVHTFRGRAAIHVGHFVWQDLSGLGIMVDTLKGETPPRCLVLDTPHHPEIFGPIDSIFPELRGRVERHERGFAEQIRHFYRERLTAIRVTSMSVPADVRQRILLSLQSTPDWQTVARAAAEARRRGPVVVIGLRVGNRTLADMDGFTMRLARMLDGVLDQLTLVIDGHNSYGEPDEGEEPAAPPEEKRIARAVSEAFAGTGTTVIDLIGRTAPYSVLWCAQADFFVAPWGAALAKYRWVCNTPGLALAGRWNLENRGDLVIYNHPAAMQDPTMLLFNPVEGTHDVSPDHGADRSDYTLDENATFALVRGLIESTITEGSRRKSG